MIQKELNAVQEAFHQAFKIGCAAQPTLIYLIK